MEEETEAKGCCGKRTFAALSTKTRLVVMYGAVNVEEAITLVQCVAKPLALTFLSSQMECLVGNSGLRNPRFHYLAETQEERE